MFGLKNTIALALLFAGAFASPVALEERQSATKCGSVSYTAAKVSAAAKAAYSHVKAGTQVGSNNYPHVYNNYEGFDFPVSGTYYEFPLLSSGSVYTGGSPGADRVVINKSGQYAGAITHTGASGNNFVGCSGTS